MYNVSLYSNNHNYSSSFYKQFYSPKKNHLFQYQKNYISYYQDQNRMNDNSFYSNAQSPYIFPIPKNRMNNFIQRTPSPPPNNRLIFNYKNNYTKLAYNHSPQNLTRLSRNMINQFSPMNIIPRQASPDPLNATTNNNQIYPYIQNPITSININNKVHKYAKTPEPKRNHFDNSLNISNSNPNNISGSQSNLSNMNNMNNLSPVNNITHIPQYSNNIPINQGNQNNINNNLNQNNVNVFHKISQNSIRNSKDLVNNNNIININYQMPNMNNNLNVISQNKNFQNVSNDKTSSISNNYNSSAHNIHVINPQNINQNQINNNSSGKNIPAINYNPNQNFSPQHFNQNQNNYNSSGKNIPVINYNPNHNFSPLNKKGNNINSSGKNNPVIILEVNQNINQNKKKDIPDINYNLNKNNSSENINKKFDNSSGKNNPVINYDPNQNKSSQNIDPNLNNYNYPVNNINNIHVIYPISPHFGQPSHLNIIPKEKPINGFFRRNLNQIVITKPVPNDNFDPSEFTIISQIGEGSFGKIFCVQWIKNFEKYAMKKLNLFGQEELIILQNKVKIVQNLQKKTGHNGFTTIYGDKCIPVPRPNEYHYYIIMELVEKDWEVELKRRRLNSEFYTEYELLNIVKQLVKTLSIMQKNNVTHRDIKPQNILIKGGLYKLCDFDEVKIVYHPQPCMHSVRGSELYMSPILFYAFQNKTPSIVHNTYKSDVFSLGMCILLAAGLTARTLCDIREIKDMNIITEIIVSRLLNMYSPNLIKLIIKMLQLEETLRFDFIELEEYILQIWPN